MARPRLLIRGLADVRAEFSLTALAYNLRRALNILGVEAVPPEEGHAALSARTGVLGASQVATGGR